MSYSRKAMYLVLEDGSVYSGQRLGAETEATGEVVFNTVLSGYQEVITDPSYAGQIITFTYPHIGNYGTNEDDNESSQPFCRGMVVRDLSRRHSNWRATQSLDEMLNSRGIAGIAGVDTRRLTRHIRNLGSMPGAFGTVGIEKLKLAASEEPGTDNIDLVKTVTCREMYKVPSTGGKRKIVAYDFGIKATILRHLSNLGEITVVPADTSSEVVLDMKPDGVFLSNGPGDPEPCDYAQRSIERLLKEKMPLFGICLGHQLLSLASGARSMKMKVGHHGANHPVQDLESGEVMITSQNHGFAVDDETLPENLKATHRSLFDHSLQGVERTDCPAFSFQGHPEASPGPHDVAPLFDHFIELMQPRRRDAEHRV